MKMADANLRGLMVDDLTRGRRPLENVAEYATDDNGNVTGLMGPDGALIDSLKVPANIAIIGDSRARNNFYDWNVTVSTPSSVPSNGQFIQYLGVQGGGETSGTGLYEYNHATGQHRWTYTGDADGAWQPALVGKSLLESGAANKGLRVMIWAPLTADISQAITLSASRTNHTASFAINQNGLFATLKSEYFGDAEIVQLGAGGCRTRDLETMIPYYAREAGGAGVDVVFCGTNDITNNVTSATMIAAMTNMFSSRLAIGRRLVIIGEHARWGTNTTTPMTAGQIAVLLEYNAWLESFAADNPEVVAYVDTLTLTQDPEYSDLRPIGSGNGGPLMLYDAVHPGAGFRSVVHPVVISAIERFIVPTQRRAAKKSGDIVDFGTMSWLPGTNGTVASGTSTTGVPTNVSVSQSENVTSTFEKTYLRSQPGTALEITYTSTGGASQYARAIGATVDIATLGLAVGDWVQAEAIIEIDSCDLSDLIESHITYIGRTIRATINPGTLPGTYRMVSVPHQVPLGTTGATIRIDITPNSAAASSGKVRWGACLLRKVAAP
jgi:hypothetical protein